jgi:ABC-type bacteriocin/lantibiotic exporter with double-glycine peptidase domain
MPRGIYGYVWQVSGTKQIWLSLLTAAVFLLSLVPLELQRQVVNDAVAKRHIWHVTLLCSAYVAVTLIQGGLKLALNVFRGSVSETAVRTLRRRIYQAGEGIPGSQGIQVSMIIAEADAVGGFVGVSISEPLLQLGILMSVAGYMLFLQPWIAVISFALVSPQFFFVPPMQRAINRRVQSRIQTLRQIAVDLVEDREKSIKREHETTFVSRINSIFRANMGIFRLKFTMNFLMNYLHHLGIAGVLLLGGWQVIEGKLDLGTVVAFISGLSRINEPLGGIVDYFREVTSAQVKYRMVASALASYADAAGARLTLQLKKTE